MTEFPVGEDLIDVRILNILVKRQFNGHKRGVTTKYIGWKIGRDNLHKVAGELRSLWFRGLVESEPGARVRWRATTKAIEAHGFAEGSQTSMERWL